MGTIMASATARKKVATKAARMTPLTIARRTGTRPVTATSHGWAQSAHSRAVTCKAIVTASVRASPVSNTDGATGTGTASIGTIITSAPVTDPIRESATTLDI